MTQRQIFSEKSITKYVAESTLGGGGTAARTWISKADGFPVTKISEVPVMDARQYAWDKQTPSQSLKSWEWKISQTVRMLSAKLNAAATPATPANIVGLKTAFGGSGASNESAGTTIGGTGTATTTTFTCGTAGHYARFQVNQFINVVISGVNYWSIVKAVNSGSNAITLAIALPSIPADGAVVHNMLSYCPTHPSGGTMYIEHVFPDHSDLQFKLYGGLADLEFGMDSDKACQIVQSYKGKSWERGALSLDTSTYTADTQGAQFVWSLGDCIIQGPNTTTRSLLTLVNWSFKIMYAGAFINEITATGSQGASGAYRQLSEHFAEIQLRTLFDVDWWTTYTAQSQVRCAFVVPAGSGTSKQFYGHHFPRATIIGDPTIVKDGEGNPLYMDITLHAQIDPTESTVFGRAPYIVSIG